MNNISIEKLHLILHGKIPNKYSNPLEELFFADFREISDQFDLGGSDSFSWRNCYFSRQLATLLLDKEGKFDDSQLNYAIELSKKSLFSLYAYRADDAIFRLHIDRMLEAFSRDSNLVKAFYMVRAPLGNPIAVKMIKQSLFLEDKVSLTDRNTRISVLSALFCKLRQNVGSCFATAFAIRIQEQDPIQFFQDLHMLCQQGLLKRVVEGQEFFAPMNANFGLGELKKPLFFFVELSEILRRLSLSYPLLFSMAKTQILQESDALLQLLLKSAIPHVLQQEFLTYEKIFELLLLAYYQLDPNEVKTWRKRNKQLHLGIDKKEIVEFEKKLQIAKSSFVNLTDHALLKSWEFTLASFSEAESNMAQWNLTTSLGLNPESDTGIGQFLQKKIQERLRGMNHELESLQHQMNHAALQLDSLQRRAATANSESELLSIQSSYRMQNHELNRLLALRDELHAKGTALAQSFPKILEFIHRQYKECFQEVYDPEMQEVSVGIFDDMPAGFRLCYKHGRMQPSSWTIIQNLDEFIRMISEFFLYLEFTSLQEDAFVLFKDELASLWRAVHHLIKDPSFQRECFIRLAAAFHESLTHDPLQYPETIKHKPWAYVSGGKIEGLYHCYYRKKIKNEKTIEIHSPYDLLLFYIHTMREANPQIDHTFTQNYLAFSPTHAFLLTPEIPSFMQAWKNVESPALWLENWRENNLRKIDTIRLEEQEKEKLNTLLLSYFSPSHQQILKKQFTHLPIDQLDVYEKAFLSIFANQRHIDLNRLTEKLQALFYEVLPFFSSGTLLHKVEQIFNELHVFSKQELDRALYVAKQAYAKIGHYQILTAKELLLFVQTALMGALKKSHIGFDVIDLILAAMKKLGFTICDTILVGNTNWTKEYFGFLVNPVTKVVDFWRCDFYGRKGFPLLEWSAFLNGQTERKWGIVLD